MARVLFLFLDGVGIGPASPELNPFLRARLPALRSLLGAIPTLDDPSPAGATARCFPLDATLGVDGIPQSGTGQIALLTGQNAARIHGHHFGPWPPVALRPLLEKQSLLRRACAAGHAVVFANAYPPGFPGKRSARLVAAPPIAARAAGLMTLHGEALARGEALASEIENTFWRRHAPEDGIPAVTAESAGENLGRIAGGAELTFFAHYATDHAGHGGRGRNRKNPAERMSMGIAALERVDRFLSGILRTLDPETLLLVASDHGNIEDVSREHTLNPALGLLVGRDCGRADGLARITDVADAVLDWLASPSLRPGDAPIVRG